MDCLNICVGVGYVLHGSVLSRYEHWGYFRNGHLFFVGYHVRVDIYRRVGVVLCWVEFDNLEKWNHPPWLPHLLRWVVAHQILHCIRSHCILCLWIVATTRFQLLIVTYEHTCASSRGVFRLSIFLGHKDVWVTSKGFEVEHIRFNACEDVFWCEPTICIRGGVVD